MQGGKVPRSKSWCLHNYYFSFPFCCNVWWLGPRHMPASCDIIFHYQGETIVKTGIYYVFLDVLKVESFLFFVNCILFITTSFSLWFLTETWWHTGDDFWWSLCYHDDGIVFHLHRTRIQWVFFCPFWNLWALCVWVPWSLLQVASLPLGLTDMQRNTFGIAFCKQFLLFHFRDASTVGLVKVRSTYHLAWTQSGMVPGVNSRFLTPWKWRCQFCWVWLKWILESCWATLTEGSLVMTWIFGKLENISIIPIGFNLGKA